MERSVEPGLDIHVTLDNYATHKHETVRRWLKRNPRVHLHFIPTGASWLNMVERLFSELTEKRLRRLAVNSVAELEAAGRSTGRIATPSAGSMSTLHEKRTTSRSLSAATTRPNRAPNLSQC